MIKELKSMDGQPDAIRCRKMLEAYRAPNSIRSMAEVAVTAIPLALLWIAAWFAYWSSLWWLSLLLTVPAAGFLVRLFMIQHDCGHGAFFTNRHANDWVGRVIGVFTLTPYGVWRRTHAIHHATSGNLDRRGIGDITTLTVAEYRALSPRRRLAYRLYRHPIVLLGIGPAYLFLAQQRYPRGLTRNGWKPWLSAMGTNLAIALLSATIIWLVGIEAFLLVYLPTTILAATAGVWLFYVQHQFESTNWDREQVWSHHHNALYSSSHYALPPPFQWLTGNIGIHHVHHLCSRIPYYRLPEVIRHHPELGRINRLDFREGLSCLKLVLWDEPQRRLISFKEFKAREFFPVA